MARSAPVQIIAHRGASHDAPENTLSSIALGWAQQADAVEMDIRLTRDGAIVLLHDDTFMRTTGHPGTAESLDLAVIRTLEAGRWKAPAFAGEKIPTLTEALAMVPPGRSLLIELKAGTAIVPALRRVLESGPLPLEHAVIIAFDHGTLRAAKTALPRAKALHLAAGGRESAARPQRELEALIAGARAAKFDGLNLGDDWPFDAALVRRIHDAGLLCYVWTVNDPVRARYLADAGVDGIATDRPGWIRRHLAADGPV